MAYNDMVSTYQPSSRARRFIFLGFLIAVIVISVVGSVLIVLNWQWIERLQQGGYWGLFIISIFAGSPIPIPTPSMILTFTLGGVLNPFAVGMISGVGNGLGNALIFWTGHGGRAVFKNFLAPTQTEKEPKTKIGRFFRRIAFGKVPDKLENRVPLAVFLLSLYPNPVLTPLILGMGAMRYRFWKFFIAIMAGKIAQSMVLSYLGYFGLRSLLKYFGVFDMP